MLPTPETIIEPFKIKTVEPIPMLTYEQRCNYIKKAYYNLFFLDAESVTFDFLTDSGTGALSANQWAGLMVGDESYAGSRSFKKFEKTVQDVTGFEYIIPTHQGRAAEFLLFKVLSTPGKVVIGNTHFDTTRANIEMGGSEALDLPSSATEDSESMDDFKGNIDIEALSNYLKENSSKVTMVILTVTSNSVGGQPVSMQNIKDTKNIVSKYNIPLFLDMARFAENSYFIKLREPGYSDKSIPEICRQMFDLADGGLMSAKKDAFGNIGGFLALRSSELAAQIRTQMVLTEGFPTYGGLAGRDLEALAIGIKEIQEEDYLKYRISSTAYLGKGLEDAGFKLVKPFGGHAIYIDAGLCLPHIPSLEFPGQSMSVALYEEIGIRSVEIGTVMLGRKDHKTGKEYPAPKELVRLAIPRRVYTQSHIDYIIESAHYLTPMFEKLKGYKFIYQSKFLRHFTAKFQKII